MAQEMGIIVGLDYSVEAAKYTLTFSRGGRIVMRRPEEPKLPPRPWTNFEVEPLYVADRIPLKRVDAWGVRSEFLSIRAGDTLRLRDFLNRRGIWSESHKGSIYTKKLVSGLW